MQLEIEFENPVIVIETSTPQCVDIHADATITIAISQGINSMIIPVDNFLVGNDTDTYTMPVIPFLNSEMIFVGGSIQIRGTDYTITGDQLVFNTIVPSGIPIWVHGWKV